jgi:hypothetical protein
VAIRCAAKRLIFGFSLLSFAVDVFMPVAGNSFPSGHVMFYTVFFSFLLFFAVTRLPRSLWRAVAVILTGGLIVSVGPSRMYLGAHWLSDVIAAYLFGIIILVFGIEFYLRDLAPRAPTQQEGMVGAHMTTPSKTPGRTSLDGYQASGECRAGVTRAKALREAAPLQFKADWRPPRMSDLYTGESWACETLLY